MEKRLKKFLFVSDYAYAGGAELVMKNIVDYLVNQVEEDEDNQHSYSIDKKKYKYDVSIGTLYDETENIEKHYSPLVKYYNMSRLAIDPKYNKYKKLDPRRVWAAVKRRLYKKKLIEHINIERYDVVIAMKEGDVMALLQDVHAKKKIGWIHVDYNYLHWTAGLYGSNEAELECMKKYDNIVCVSRATYDSVREVVGNPYNLIIRENPLDVEKILELSKEEVKSEEMSFDEGVKDIDSDSIKENDKMILVSVGRLCEHKNYMSLLKAALKAKSVAKDSFELWIIGDGEDRERLEAYVKEYNMENVRFLGTRYNPYPYIKKADWFVTTTKGESYGLAVQEALILGVPVLATRCNAFEECMSEEEAILVENTEDDIYSGLIKILGNRELKDTYKARIQERNNENMYKNRLEDIEKLLTGVERQE